MQLKPEILKLFKKVKPWAFMIALFLVLRYTGILAGISDITSRAILQTGAMDASTETPSVDKSFDYGFTLTDIKSERIDVSQFKGKTIFINLWATWCGPCRAEMPSIQSLYSKVDQDKVKFIMLSLDQKDPLSKVSSYIENKSFTFPVYFPASTLPNLLQVRSIPTTFVINPEGKVVYKEMGTANYDTDKFLKFLMEQ